MSTTQIDYDLVVQELSKGMYALDSYVAKATAFNRPTALSEFRTIHLGAGRQKGLGLWLIDKFIEHPGHTLILTPQLEMGKDFARLIKEQSGLSKLQSGMVIGNDVPDNIRHVTFDRVFVVSSGHYFNKFKFSKVYEHLATCTTDDVIIYHLN